MGQFDDNCGQGLWTWLPVTPALADKTAAVYARLPRTAFLRAADAVHLISAREHRLPETTPMIVTCRPRRTTSV